MIGAAVSPRVDLLSLLVPLALVGVAGIIDLRTREIPDWIAVALVAWGLVATSLRWNGLTFGAVAVGAAVGIGIGLALFASGGFGGGDAKLVIGLGPALGWRGLLWSLTVMALAGGLLSVVAACRRRRDLAYAPAIAVGVLSYVLVYGWVIYGRSPGAAR